MMPLHEQLTLRVCPAGEATALPRLHPNSGGVVSRHHEFVPRIDESRERGLI